MYTCFVYNFFNKILCIYVQFGITVLSTSCTQFSDHICTRAYKPYTMLMHGDFELHHINCVWCTLIFIKLESH